MTLRERVLELSRIGGYDIIPNVKIKEVNGSVILSSGNKNIIDVLFSDEDNSFIPEELLDRCLVLTSEMLDKYETTPKVSVGIVEYRSGDCLSGEEFCECPVCQTGYITMTRYSDSGEFMKTIHNKVAYVELRKALGVRVCDEYLIEILKRKYLEMIETPLDSKMVIRCTDSAPYSTLVFSDQRTQDYTLLCNPEKEYDEASFIRSAFTLAYERAKDEADRAYASYIRRRKI